ncbi:hypothetical protein D7030_00970 [Flavobacteriaceae bacterium AU392]|nr:hypothetical protein D1817_02955 [Flavobacteriaceae bacterium]RKM86627.1 hypothetical protein D7030_00970 [Flavobacteriaceae bacterium AU392]
MKLPITFNELIEEANALSLYEKLVHQINKDFLLANIDLQFSADILPKVLKQELHEKIYRLIQGKFAEYLNLLYIIDVPEYKVKELNGDDVVELSNQVSFLILQREWQKVWLRNKY